MTKDDGTVDDAPGRPPPPVHSGAARLAQARPAPTPPKGTEGSLGGERGKNLQGVIKGLSKAMQDSLDYRAARTLEAKERALLLRMERQQRSGELITLAEAQGMIETGLAPVRQFLLSLATSVCSQANPSDPELARQVIQRAVDLALPAIRAQLPKPRQEKGQSKAGLPPKPRPLRSARNAAKRRQSQ